MIELLLYILLPSVIIFAALALQVIITVAIGLVVIKWKEH